MLKVEEEDEEAALVASAAPGKKRATGILPTKKIYPVSISFHQKLKLLALCLIDCDIKIYNLKSSGTSLHVNDYHSFYSAFIPCTSHLAEYKINDKVILALASENGQVEIYSLDEKEKGRVIHSMKIGYSVREHGPITKVFYNADVGLIVSTFKGMLQVYDSMEFKLLWETANTSQRKEKITITTFDYSQKAGLIAVGGVDGKIAVFDPSAKILTAQTKAHEGSEVMDVYFYDK